MLTPTTSCHQPTLTTSQGVPFGEVVATPAFRLKAEKILHAVGPMPGIPSTLGLRSTYALPMSTIASATNEKYWLGISTTAAVAATIAASYWKIRRTTHLAGEAALLTATTYRRAYQVADGLKLKSIALAAIGAVRMPLEPWQ